MFQRQRGAGGMLGKKWKGERRMRKEVEGVEMRRVARGKKVLLEESQKTWGDTKAGRRVEGQSTETRKVGGRKVRNGNKTVW